MAPAVLLELLIHVLPTLLGVVLSLLRVDPSTVADWPHAPFAGLGNYRSGLDGRGPVGAEFLHTLGRTIGFTAVVVAVSWALGMFAAVLLSTQFRGRGFFRAYFLLPFALPAYVTGIGWRFMLGRDTGVVNRLLVDDLHLVDHRPFWLTGPNAFWAIALVAVWRMWPFAYLVLHAAMTSVPIERYEAAAIDGATAVQRFRAITLPAIGRTNALVVLVMALWSFDEFTIPYVVFGGSPPPSGTLIAGLIYRDAFATFDLGVASALNVVLVVALLVVSLPLLAKLRRREPVDA